MMPSLDRRSVLLAALSSLVAPAHASGPMQLVQLVPTRGHLVRDASDLGMGLQAGFGDASPAGRRFPLRKYEVDQEDPSTYMRRLTDISSQAPTVLLAPLGPVAVTAILQSGLLDRQDLWVINPVPGAEAFRRPGHAKALHVRASDGDQVRRIVQHASTIGIRRLTLATENDGTPVAASLWHAASQAASATGSLELQHVQVDKPDQVSDAIAKSGFKPQGVASAGPPPFMARVAQHIRQASPGMHVYVMSYLTSAAAHALLGPEAQGIAIAQVFPNVNRSSMPLIREFRSAMQRHHPTAGVLNEYHLEGYIVARLISHGLQRMHAATPTELAAAIRRAGRIDLGGFDLDYANGNEGGRYVELGMIDARGMLRS